MPERSVGVLRRAGLGDVLLGTAAAWRYAAATGRTLRLDWRHSRYASAPTNLFSEVFQPMSHWRGVPVWLPPSTEPLEPYPPLTAADERRSGLEACELVQSGRQACVPLDDSRPNGTACQTAQQCASGRCGLFAGPGYDAGTQCASPCAAGQCDPPRICWGHQPDAGLRGLCGPQPQ